jgi:hypothetical protein
MTTTTTTAKAVNYTAEQTAALLEGYANGSSVELLAAGFGKSVRSIVAKLSREKVYVKKEYKTKAGEAVVKKDALADKMASVFDLTEAEADSLTKANKTALMKILAKVGE